MRLALKTFLTTLALGLGLAVTGAQAAPAGSVPNPLKGISSAGGAVEQAHYVRRCYYNRYRHRRVCRHVWVAPRRYRYVYRTRPIIRFYSHRGWGYHRGVRRHRYR